MSSRNNDIVMLIAMLVLCAVAYVMKVPRMSGIDLALITALGLVAIDFRLRGI
jgi:hypothetical protein